MDKIRYCQFNEEELLNPLLLKKGYFVEIGCLADHKFSNTKHLHDKGWKGLWFDMEEHEGMIKEKITADNINDILKKYKVPKNLDFMSIDIDGCDYYVFEAMKWKPKILCIEYNKTMIDGVMPRDDDYVWKGGWRFGASEKAMVELAKKKGYRLVEKNESNLIFICQSTTKK